jgi:hypothetical protein
MKKFLTLAMVFFALGIFAISAQACTATSTVDKAKTNHDTDEYESARDVAEEMIDEEGWEKDEPTLEAGAGTLLMEKQAYSLQVPNNGATPDDWRSVLDNRSARGHGITTSGANSYGTTCTVKDHMRMHIKEWDEALKGNNPSLMNWWENGSYGNLQSQDHAG